MEEITSLDVHHFNGEEYEALKRYLEKRGCTWSEKREAGRLIGVHLDFPPETKVKQLPSSTEMYKRHQVVFPNDSGLMYWDLERASKKNRISVPYVYL